MRRLIVDDLIDDVRQMLDEENEFTIDDERDILPALNRGQDYCANILARHYEPPLLTFESVDVDGTTDTFDLPENALEQRLEKIDVSVNGNYYPVKRVSYRDMAEYESDNLKVQVPTYYAVIGDTFKLIPAPSGTYNLRIWYLKDPLPLVKQQGRITLINVSSNYLIVDSAGSDLSTTTTSLSSYVNLVDGQSGRIKASMQVQSVDGNRIKFKTTPDRTNVLNSTIVGEIPTTIEEDDYICLSSGSCVPFMKKPTANFMIQYAVSELKRKLGYPVDAEENKLKALEDQVEGSWIGREITQRVKKRSRQWSSNGRRFWINSGSGN